MQIRYNTLQIRYKYVTMHDNNTGNALQMRPKTQEVRFMLTCLVRVSIFYNILYNIFLEIFFIKMFLILISRKYLEIFEVG